MPSSLFGRDVLSLADITPQEVAEILEVAASFKADPQKCIDEAPLKGKAIAIIMQKPSLRTRVSFEVGCSRLGAHPVVMMGTDGAFSREEPINDTAQVLERFCDAIVLRTFEDSFIEEVAHFASVPVVNALTDGHHPCQGLADLLTIKEKFGSFEGLKFVYTGDGANNMAHTYLLACALVGMDVFIATPRTHLPDAAVVHQAKEIARETGAHVHITEDCKSALRDADIVMTDTFTSMGQEDEHDERLATFLPYQVNAESFALASPRAVFMHCLPAHRGEEVTSDVIDSNRSIIYDQAENRLHAQQALLYLLLHERD